MDAIELVVRIERKQPDLPAFVVVLAEHVVKWNVTATTIVEGTLDAASMGRRSMKRWGDDRWFIELRRETLAAVGKGPGDRARLVVRLASTELPGELQSLLNADASARERWERMTDSQRRTLREDLMAAKSSSTRDRRARRALLTTAEPAVSLLAQADAMPHSVRLRIIGRQLPGRTCGPYSDVSVGLGSKKAGQLLDAMRADVPQAVWETELEVRGQACAATFRGELVRNQQRESFVYLTWLGREGVAAPAMFRRAKLRLDAVPPDVLTQSLRSGLLVARLALTAPDGMPLCASVQPPVVAWSAH